MTEIPLTRDLLHVEYTLVSGQAFRWRRDSEGWWVCAFQTDHGPKIIRVKQGADGQILQPVYSAGTALYNHDYFRLNVDLEPLCDGFLASDPDLSEALGQFRGLRVLRQDPTECLFSFICTSAAPLHRIRKSVAGLCAGYGEKIVDRDGTSFDLFPMVERLAESDIGAMRAMGLGYRSVFIRGAAEAVMQRGGAGWLQELRMADYATAHSELCGLPGVGAKIADCVCLFALDKDQAIPVDTHIWRAAVRRYGIGAKAKSLTPAIYREIGDSLRERFGPYAGWAQQYLFFADLYERGAWGAYVKQLG